LKMNKPTMSGDDIKLLESMKKKKEFLDQHSKQYQPMTKREEDILMSGWAACETMIGLERLEQGVQEVEISFFRDTTPGNSTIVRDSEIHALKSLPTKGDDLIMHGKKWKVVFVQAPFGAELFLSEVVENTV